MNQIPLVRLEMEGNVKFPVCATCVALYIGEISTTKEVMDNVAVMVKTAEQDGEKVAILKLPEVEFRPLRPAITIAHSVYDRQITAFYPDAEGNRIPHAVFLDPPGPVCWVHIQGFKPETGNTPPVGVVPQEKKTTLITGKPGRI